MKSYKPIYTKLFQKHGYSWDDLDLNLYARILKEEGYNIRRIKEEINFVITLGII